MIKDRNEKNAPSNEERERDNDIIFGRNPVAEAIKSG